MPRRGQSKPVNSDISGTRYVLGYPPGLLSEMSELGAASGHLVPEIPGAQRRMKPGRRAEGALALAVHAPWRGANTSTPGDNNGTVSQP